MRICEHATSGLVFVENKDKSVSLMVEDYNVESFGGMDYETTYTLSQENYKKLREVLNITNDQAAGPILREVLGDYFDTGKFKKICKENNIEYERFIWIS